MPGPPLVPGTPAEPASSCGGLGDSGVPRWKRVRTVRTEQRRGGGGRWDPPAQAPQGLGSKAHPPTRPGPKP